MSGVDDTTKLITLFKKGLGYTNTGNNTDLASEYPANASPALLLNKLFTQSVPTSAPSLVGGSKTTAPAATIGAITTPADPAYSHLKYYENVTLTSWNSKDDIFHFVPVAGYPNNLLTNIIPFNLDPIGGYDITIEVGNTTTPIFKEDIVLDRDAGVIRIVTNRSGQVNKTNPPRLVKFWRYEGTLGDIASASSGASTSSVFISNATSNLNMSSFRITNLSTPISSMDAVNKIYVDNLISDISGSVISSNLAKWAQYKAISTIDMSGFQIKNVSAGSLAGDAVNYAQLVSGLATKLDLSGGAMTTALNMSNFKINNVSAGSLAGDAVNYAQLISGLAQKLDLSGGLMRGDIDMSGIYKIKNLSAGSVAGDAVNYQQLMSGLAQKLDLSGGKMAGAIDMSGFKINNLGWTTDGSGAVSLDRLRDYVPVGTAKGQYLYYNGSKWDLGGNNNVLIGTDSAATQGTNSIAIGKGLATNGQADNAIAIGSRIMNVGVSQYACTIMLNASNEDMNTSAQGGFYVKPIRRGTNNSMLYYNTASGEITYADVSGGTIVAGTYGGWIVEDLIAPFGVPDKLQVMTTNMTVDMNDNRLQNLGTATNGGDAVRYDQLTSLSTAVATNFLRKDGSTAMTGNLDMSSFRVTNLGDASTMTDAVSLKYLSSYLSSFMRITPGTSSINAGGNVITNVSAGSSALEAVNYQQLMSGLALKLDLSGGTMKGAIDMSGFAITNLSTPTNAQLNNAATVQYVQQYVSSLSSLGSGGSSANWSLSPAISTVNMSSFRITNLNTPISTMDAANKGYVDAIDAWLDTYVRDKPPAPTQINVLPAGTSTEIYMAFANPLQKKYGISTKMLPIIDTIRFDVSGVTGNLFIGSDSAKYITDLSAIDLIVITNNASMAGRYVTKTLDLSGGGTKVFTAYYLYNTSVNGLASTGAINVELWYDNNSATSLVPNKLAVTLPGYISASPPSVPLNVLAGNTGSQTSVVASWSSPQYADATNSTITGSAGAPTISYKLTAIPRSTVRYGGLFNTTAVTNTNASSGSSMAVTLPGTQFSTIVSAKNNLNATYTDAAAVFTSTILPSAPASIASKGITVPTNSYDNGTSYKLVGGGTTLSDPLLKAGTNKIITDITNVGVHNASNPGSIASNIMTVTAKINGTNRSEATFGGFPAANPTVTTNALVDISGYNVASTGSGASANFYLDATISATLKPATGDASVNAYTLQLAQAYADSSTANSASQTFRVDDLIANPSAAVTSFGGFNNTLVCGVPILNNSQTLNAAVQVTNAARYYYPASGILSYNIRGVNSSGSATFKAATTLTDFSLAGSLTAPISGNITHAINGIATNITAGAYYSTIRFAATPINLIASGTEAQNNINALIDYNSITIKEATSPGTIPSITTPTVNNSSPFNVLSGKAYVTGLRINSVASASASVYYPNSTSGQGITAYNASTSRFDNSGTNLMTNAVPELQIINGGFQTKVSEGLAYKNYSGFNGTGPDYSSGSNFSEGVRFATFIWKVPKNGAGYTGSITNLVLKISGIKNSGVASTLVDMSGIILKTSDSKSLYLYHRTTEFDASDISYNTNTTVWADDTIAYMFYGANLATGNAWNTSQNGTLGGRPTPTDAGYSLTPGVAIIKLNTDGSMNLNKDAHVYVRIGLDMTSTMSFEKIELGICE